MSSMPRPAATALEVLKLRQQATWSSGDYSVVGTTLQIVGEQLCEALDLRAGSRVLDVAAGNGNATLAAARRFCRVTSTDYVPALLDAGRRRAEAEGIEALFETADAEQLPYPDAGFDAVISTFGVMFTADHARAAGELLRVCRPGGRIGLASWTPGGFIGQVFQRVARFQPAAPGARSPAAWGDVAYLRELFGSGVDAIRAELRHFVFRYRSPRHWIEVFRDYYGPIHRLYASLDAEAQDALTAELETLLWMHNRSGDGSLVVPSAYLEVVCERA